mmetsp:Transcript_785/g.1646  ORF Transcript_785/g.1646 Transcript_785/m.1646 type:complete len:239 (-) Transcript_785:836-1552(-)
MKAVKGSRPPQSSSERESVRRIVRVSWLPRSSRKQRRVTTRAMNPIQAYDVALSSAPLITRCCTCGVLFTLSDVVAQWGRSRTKPMDVSRLTRYGCFGFFLNAPMFVMYYALLDRVVDGTVSPGLVNTVIKVCFDQFIWTPFFYLPIFFGVLALWEGKTLPASIEEARERGWGLTPVLISNWKFWFPVVSIAFGLVPPEYRITFNNTCMLVWNTYLSRVQNKDGREDEPRTTPQLQVD